MPTSVPGSSERGFTLVEVLVVLVIVAIAASMVSLSIGKRDNGLRADAERLADAFTVAQSEARSDGRPIRWLADDQGWSFERQGRLPGPSADENVPVPVDHLEHDDMLRPQSWHAGVVHLVLAPDRPLVFNTEWVADPITLTLRAGDDQVTLQRDAAGRYDIR
ncbi:MULTISPECIES: type II secretion system minor pseudopilin GspH [Achromobacter]|uniref:Type II secretion system protein H n=1 Tax=Achromobacter spanius TaxID=217203 RepID=A0ABY8GUY6_9BURK|nr:MULTISPECIES: type II secretion system minor pseudopilin GspH [Achromobacter]WAI82094.1 type II secretion system minor pseudopilin GspH [Achromobacter spanius]WEX92183.1 type II secretion system minor pseudopilin GspH [Achromobacter sp. SS2-2022]WFP08670.1 type II secretion system minor pseudopilin GspH [Achromobacter spanius]